MLSFTFPQTEKLEIISTKEQLQKQIRKQKQQSRQAKQIKYYFKEIKKIYLIAQCKFCQAKLSYKLEDTNYKLYRAIVQHDHSITKKNRLNIQRFISQLPNQIRGSTAFTMIKNNFSLSKSTFYRIFNKVKNEQYQISEIFNLFGKQGIIGHYQPIQYVNLPDLIIITNKQMKAAFQRFGDYCAFDFTYNLIREKSQKNNQYSLGFFTGLNCHLKILPYAIVITDNQTKERMGKIFYEFFKLMGKLPKIIITDQQKSMQAGLNLLQYENIWSGLHLLDSFHILRNIRKKLQKKSNIQYFSNLIKAKNEAEFSAKLKQLRDNFKEQKNQIIQRFIQNAHRYCFSKIPQSFVGFYISSNSCEKMNDLLKNRIPMSQKLGVVLKKTYGLCNYMIEQSKFVKISNIKIGNMVGFPQLEQLRKLLCQKIFLILIKKMFTAIFCIVKKIQASKFSIMDQYGSFTVTIIQNQDFLDIQCQCLEEKKNGLPCLHMIKVALLKELNIKTLINQRWFLSDCLEQKQILARIKKPKKTRRR